MEDGWALKMPVDPGHIDTLFLAATNGLEQILTMKTSPSIANKGIIQCPLFKIPDMKDLFRSWPSARALMRLMSRLDIEQTAVMLLA